ncbi:MAG: 3' terminal RNA ribose 2'-O-methyltransferase Hen1 [Hyphomonadaceae bacterium]
MYLSIATTHAPATDLGYLLMKHPERVHETELTFGKAVVLFPEASEARCEAALVLDVDPVGLVRGRGQGEGLLSQYVNDRPYAATSFLSVALNKAFRTAMNGESRERPELAKTKIPLEVRVTPLPGGADMVRAFFEPLGWDVTIEPVAGAGRYVSLTLRGAHRVSDALSHLYVLIPALDADKHYWVGEDEIEKLLAKASGWLGSHPQKEQIAQRYLKRRSSLVKVALARLAPEEVEEADAETPSGETPKLAPEEALEAPIRLNDVRLDTVHATLKDLSAWRVADLGCGEGKLLQRLAQDRKFTRIFGLDAAARELEKAARRLKLERAGAPVDRITLLHGALTYRDARWTDVDAACLIEVIEHLDAERLPALEAVVFGKAKPRYVLVTTPNVEHNALFVGMTPGAFRHPDHRFEWTRAEFQDWAGRICAAHGYEAEFHGIGADDPVYGPPTQMAVFRR